MPSPKAAEAAPSSPQSPRPAHISNRPSATPSPTALIDSAAQEQDQGAAIEADVSVDEA